VDNQDVLKTKVELFWRQVAGMRSYQRVKNGEGSGINGERSRINGERSRTTSFRHHTERSRSVMPTRDI